MTDIIETKQAPPDKELLNELILDLTILANNKFMVEIDKNTTAKLDPVEVVRPDRTEVVAKEIALRMNTKGVLGFHFIRPLGYETLYNLAKSWGGEELFTKEESAIIEAEIEEYNRLGKNLEAKILEEKVESREAKRPQESEEKDNIWEGFEKIGDENGYTIYRTNGGVFYEKDGRLMSEYTYKTEKR